jgi:hypothetical protein
MSNNLISFHYITPEMMFTMEYLIYQLKPYGIIPLPQSLSKKLSFKEILSKNRRISVLARHTSNSESIDGLKHKNKPIVVTFPIWSN